jgi:hypothetical protein
MTEPAPVLPLEYQPDGKHESWLRVVRILATLCIIDGATSALYSAFFAWHFGPLRNALAQAGATQMMLFVLQASLVIDALLGVLLLVAGAGCLGGVQFFRRLVVTCCWLLIFAGFAESTLHFFVYPGSNGAELGLESLPRAINYATFPLTVALIFSITPVKETFSTP